MSISFYWLGQYGNSLSAFVRDSLKLESLKQLVIIDLSVCTNIHILQIKGIVDTYLIDVVCR